MSGSLCALGAAVESPGPLGTEVMDTGQEAQASGLTGPTQELL